MFNDHSQATRRAYLFSASEKKCFLTILMIYLSLTIKTADRLLFAGYIVYICALFRLFSVYHKLLAYVFSSVYDCIL